MMEYTVYLACLIQKWMRRRHLFSFSIRCLIDFQGRCVWGRFVVPRQNWRTTDDLRLNMNSLVHNDRARASPPTRAHFDTIHSWVSLERSNTIGLQSQSLFPSPNPRHYWLCGTCLRTTRLSCLLLRKSRSKLRTPERYCFLGITPGDTAVGFRRILCRSCHRCSR